METNLDPSKIHIITKMLSIEQLVKRLGLNGIDFVPSRRWSDVVQSRLIESILIRIPLPALYFDATNDSRWLVVDGLQRLSTIRHFMAESDQRLRLHGLEYLCHHEGKTFDELPRHLQRQIEETRLCAYLIPPGTPIEVKFNLYKRINAKNGG